MKNKKLEFSIEALLGEPLTEKIELYIPSKGKNNEDFSELQEEYKHYLLTFFSSHFGGATAENVTGAYLSESKIKIYVENVIKIYSYAPNTLETYESIKEIIEKAKELKKDFNQECISFCVNDKLYFI